MTITTCNDEGNASNSDEDCDKNSNIQITESFWENRHPSLGLPVGCFCVPRDLMGIVQSTLAEQVKAGRGQWLRRNGTVKVPCSVNPDDGSSATIIFKIHLTTFGATQIEKWIYCNKNKIKGISFSEIVPEPILTLLQENAIEWESGARLSSSTTLLPKKPRMEKVTAATKETINGHDYSGLSTADCVHDNDSENNIINPLSSCVGTMKIEGQNQDERSRPVFQFAELFAGIGGFRLGLEPPMLRGECIFSSELDPFAAKTYEINFGYKPTVGDITTVDFDSDAASNSSTSNNNNSNNRKANNPQLPCNYELLVGGFPCQSFSHSGHQDGLYEDSNNGRLYLEVCRVLCATKPKAFLLENVANLYTLDGGVFHIDPKQRKPGRAYKTIMKDLTRCGYTVQTKIVDANSFYVPQHRDRLLFVGFANLEVAKRFQWPQELMTTNDGTVSTVRSILEPNDTIAVQEAMLTREQFKRVEPFLKCKPTDRSCRRARLDGVARTLMSSYKSGQLKHYKEFVVVEENGCDNDNTGDAHTDTDTQEVVVRSARFYTAREAARIMGFPDTYIIPGSCDKKNSKAYSSYQRFYRQIGNAVCPPVVKAVAESILNALQIDATCNKI